MHASVGGFQGCSRDKHRNNWGCAKTRCVSTGSGVAIGIEQGSRHSMLSPNPSAATPQYLLCSRRVLHACTHRAKLLYVEYVNLHGHWFLPQLGQSSKVGEDNVKSLVKLPNSKVNPKDEEDCWQKVSGLLQLCCLSWRKSSVWL